VTTIFVTHDQDEAFVLGDRVAVLRAGAIEQVGTPADLYRRPATPWVARFVGEANLLAGRIGAPIALASVEHGGHPPAGHAATVLGPVPISMHPGNGYHDRGAEVPVRTPDDVIVVVRPEQVSLHEGT
jgi:iron(III) transport system ATP-binding protein